MREHIEGRRAVRARGRPGRRRRSTRFRAEGQEYKVELIEDLVRERGRSTTVVALHQRRRSPTSAAARTRRAPSGSRRSSCSRSPAPTGAATPTARCSRASTAPRSSPRRTSTSTSSGSSRPAPATTAGSGRSSGCSRSRRSRPGSAFWLPHGHRRVQRARRAQPRDAAAARLHRGQDAADLRRRSCGRPRATGTSTASNMFVTRVRGPPDGAQADELPRPLPAVLDCSAHSYRDLPVRYSEPGLLHRHEPSAARCTACCACATSPRTTPTSSAPRTRSRTRSRAACDFALRHLRAVRPRRRARAVDAARASASAPTSCGTRREGDAAQTRSSAAGSSTTLNEGDGAFYGPKIDLHMTDSLGRSLAARHRPARLQLMPERFGLDLHRRRQRRAPAGDDPPRAVRLLRALHRDPDRALRRRAARSGWRRSRRSCCRSPTATSTTRRRRRRPAARPRRAGRARRPHRVGRAQDPRRRAAQDPVHARRRRPRGRGGRGLACASTARATSASATSTSWSRGSTRRRPTALADRVRLTRWSARHPPLYSRRVDRSESSYAAAPLDAPPAHS